MKPIVFLIGTLLSTTLVTAQQKPKTTVLPDIDKLMKMSPEEQKKYAAAMQKQLGQQAEQISRENNIKFDASALPGATLKIPMKDIKRLSLIPVAPPNRQELLSQISKMELGLKKVVDPKLVQEIEKFSAASSIREIQKASAGFFYIDNPQAGLLLGMKAVQKQPDNANNWNNLAAQLNMNKMEQLSIPILQNLLADKPNNSTVLNNIGQGYLGLGDLDKASEYLQRSLAIDPLQPEANRSMGMIKSYMNDAKAAEKYFEKEMQVAQRRSSLAQLARNGSREHLNLARLRKAKMANDGTPHRDFFSEINLAVFKVPDLPTNTGETESWMKKHQGFMESLQKELMFWTNESYITDQERKSSRNRYPGIYTDLVNELLSDLGSEYSATLGLIDEQGAFHLEQLTIDYNKAINELVCPQPPSDPGNTERVFKEYREKCCKLKKPVADKYISEYNAFITGRINIAQARWKEYINGMINIVTLDPTIENKRMVYATVSQYFTFLITAVQSATFAPGPMECDSKPAESESTELESKKDVDIECPSWLKIKLSLSVATVSTDCESFKVEADADKDMNSASRKLFFTGSSTMYIGAGIDGSSFKAASDAKLSDQFYISFDNNNKFSDVGRRSAGSSQIGNGSSVEKIKSEFSISSGFDSNRGAKSEWVNKWEQALGY